MSRHVSSSLKFVWIKKHKHITSVCLIYNRTLPYLQMSCSWLIFSFAKWRHLHNVVQTIYEVAFKWLFVDNSILFTRFYNQLINWKIEKTEISNATAILSSTRLRFPFTNQPANQLDCLLYFSGLHRINEIYPKQNEK